MKNKFSVMVSFFLFAALEAYAQCAKDTDCADPRICVKGECQYPELRPQSICMWKPGSMPQNFVPGLTDALGSSLLDEIGTVDPIELPILKSGPVEAASAIVYGLKRQIIYNPSFIDQLTKKGGRWPGIFVLAHELGHHVYGDVLDDGDDTTTNLHEREFKADEYAARVLARLGASKSQTLFAINELRYNVGPKHPPTESRLARAESAYDAELRKLQRNCGEDKQWNGSSCVRRCPDGENWQSGRCVGVCRPDEIWESGACSARCNSVGTKWDPTLGNCVSICAPDEEYIEGYCKPKCGKESRWDSSRKRCEPRCSPDFKWGIDRCVARCSAQQKWDSQGEQCVERCSEDKQWDGARCVSICEDEEKWSSVLKRCVERCASGRQWNGVRCGYPPGYGLMPCGCHGTLRAVVATPDVRCGSGRAVVAACPYQCPLGGYAWGVVCQ